MNEPKHEPKGNVWRLLRQRTGDSPRQFRKRLKAMRRAQKQAGGARVQR